MAYTTIDAGATFGESPNVVAGPARDNDLSPVSELVLIEPQGLTGNPESPR
jgi:hypothetical protein